MPHDGCGTTPTPAEALWTRLGHPRYICAPMVEQSERAFRRCCATHGGVDLCYTPMIHSDVYAADEDYREQNRIDAVEEVPVVAQVCAVDGGYAAALETVRLLSAIESVVAVDLNMGCPQSNAEKHGYGAYMPLDVGIAMIRHLVEGQGANQRALPITVKIRVQDTVNATIDRVARLIAAGAVAVAIHGRTRAQIQRDTGVADWGHLRAVIAFFRDAWRRGGTGRQAIFISNGNICTRADADECITVTGADAVMSADGLLWDFTLFKGTAREGEVGSVCPPPVLLRSGRMFYDHVPLRQCSEHRDGDATTCQARARLMRSIHLARLYIQAAVQLPPTAYQARQHLLKLLRPCIAKYSFVAAQFQDAMPPPIDPRIKGAPADRAVHLHRTLCIWLQMVACFESLEMTGDFAIPSICGGCNGVDEGTTSDRCFTTAFVRDLRVCQHGQGADCVSLLHAFAADFTFPPFPASVISSADALVGQPPALSTDVPLSSVCTLLTHREQVFATPSEARPCLPALPSLEKAAAVHYTWATRRLRTRADESDDDVIPDAFELF